MKRGRLTSDPSKTAAWQQRGRGKGLNREKRLQRGEKPLGARAQRRVTTPPEVWAAVLKRDGGWCVWSWYLGKRRRAQHPHHLLGKGRGGWPEFAATRENIVGLTGDLHMQHEFSPTDRLPWAALPAECQAFLRRVAACDARAERLIATKYPGAT